MKRTMVALVLTLVMLFTASAMAEGTFRVGMELSLIHI